MSSEFFNDDGSVKNPNPFGNGPSAPAAPPPQKDPELVQITRETFSQVKTLVQMSLQLVRVQMADGLYTTKYCMLCVRGAPRDHATVPPSCECVCHKIRELLPVLEAL